MKDRKKDKLVKATLALTLLTSGSAFSALTSGQLTIINGLANDTSTGVGTSASSISVTVSDSSGVCSLAKILSYDGFVVVKWDSTKTHSTSQCTGITTVSVTPQKTLIGTTYTIVYDSTTSTSVPATSATAAINYTAPTTPVANLVLLVTGTGIPAAATTATATVWGIGAAASPIFDSANGALATVGVPGGLGLAGFKAEEMARHYGVIPYK